MTGRRSTLKWMATGLAAILALSTVIESAAAEEASKKPTVSPADHFAPILLGQMRKFNFHQTPKEWPPITFFGPEGEIRDLREFEGKIVLVNFWALWCAPCLRELPSLDRLATYAEEELGQEVVVVAINLDRGGPEAPLAFLASEGLEKVVFLQEPNFIAPGTLQIRGMPSTMLLDRSGREIGIFEGEAEWDAAEAKLLLDKAAAYR